MADQATSNSLGLDFDALSIKGPKEESEEPQPTSAEPQPQEQSTPTKDPRQEKKKPYVNPERVKTGGPEREKLSEEALAERMQRMKEQNEKIKQRRIDVKADEEAFKKTQEEERVRQAHARKMQENVDRTREQNARRKMEKMESREWDSGKPTAERKSGKVNQREDSDTASSSPLRGIRGGRGGPYRGRGRGRGRGRDGAEGGIRQGGRTPSINAPSTDPTEAKHEPAAEAVENPVPVPAEGSS